jgi:hypothetical protein
VTGTQQLLRAPGAAVKLAGDPQAQDVAAETVGSIIGGVGGGVMGGIAGGPPGAFVAAPLGAAAGGIGASNFMVRLRGKDETPEETEERRLRAGLTGGLGELGGRTLPLVAPGVVHGLSKAALEVIDAVPGLRRVFDPLGAKRTPGGVGVEGALEAIETLGRAPGAPTPTLGQVIPHPVIQTAENIADASIATSRVAARRANAADASLQLWDDFVNDFVGAVGPTRQGEILQETLEESGRVYHALLESQWRAVDDAIRPQSFNVPAGPFVREGAVVNPVQMGPVKESLRKSFSEGRRDVLDDKLASVLEWVDAIPDQVTFQEAAVNRSILLELTRGGPQSLLPGSKIGGAKRAAKLVDDALKDAGKSLEGDAFEAWRAANASTRLGNKRFNSKLIRRLINQEDPAQAWQVISRAKSPDAINRVRAIVFDPKNIDPETGRLAVPDPEGYWRGLQGQWIKDAVERATPPKGAAFGEFDANRVLSKILKNTDSREAFEAMFPNPTQRGHLMSLLRTRQIAQNRALTGGTGGVAMQLMQTGALANVIFRRESEGAIRGFLGVMMVPSGIARALESPRLAKFLLQGATGELSGPRAARWFGQLATQLAEEGIPYFAEMDSGNGPEVFDVTPGQPAQRVGALPAASTPGVGN